MAQVTYSSTSPYFTTNYSQFFLDVMNYRTFPSESDDLPTIINKTYQYRPDLLAYDLYGTPELWWVFYQRNPNTLTAPPWDFKVGTRIYVPKITTLKNNLGF
jgi:hypothetical protein